MGFEGALKSEEFGGWVDQAVVVVVVVVPEWRGFATRSAIAELG